LFFVFPFFFFLLVFPVDFLFSAGTPDTTKTGSTAPIRGFGGRTGGFRFLAYFSIFPVFSENRTGLDTGPRLNRPVRSGF
jgi:hypothetical protein